MKRSVRHLGLIIGFAFASACSATTTTTTPGLATAAPVQDDAEQPTAPPPNPRRVGEDALAVGTFNLHWAHDWRGDDVPKLAQQHRARNEEDWAWKVGAIADVLARERLDIVALQEVGGEDEVSDIVVAIQEREGPNYSIAWVPSTDRFAGHHVALLSRYPTDNERRFDVHMRRHVAADVELPDGNVLTVVALHASGGKYPAHEKRRAKQARALKKKVEVQRRVNPVLVLGTTNSQAIPGADTYARSAAGTLAGAHTRKAADNCDDSADYLAAQRTTVAGKTVDRIMACGLKMREAESSAEMGIVRSDPDPDGVAWPDIPVDEAPHRDASDHLLVWAEIALATDPPE